MTTFANASRPALPSCPACGRQLPSFTHVACPRCGWAPDALPRQLSAEQEDFVQRALRGENLYLTGQAGCVDGDALISFSRAGLGRKIKLKDMYLKFKGLRGKARPWKSTIKTYVRSVIDGYIRLNEVIDVLDHGVKQVLRLGLVSGKSLRLTADHEVATPAGFVRADHLVEGQDVWVNGLAKCLRCGVEGDVVPERKPSNGVLNKYAGFCRECVKRVLSSKVSPDSPVPAKGGYLCWAVPKHPSRSGSSNKRVLEHRLVVEASLNGVSLREWLAMGRREGGYPPGALFLTPDKVVHHLNGDIRDNRIENLQVTTQSEHAFDHGKQGNWKNMEGGKGGKGGSVQFVPGVDRVVSVCPDGETHVYDIVCADPGRNFVANGIIVHNCGKSYALSEYIRRAQRVVGHHSYGQFYSVAVTASTGIAALNLPGGRTLHSWCGMGRGDRPVDKICTSGWFWKVSPRIERTHVLIIEEISMVGAKTLILASDLCKKARNDERPFGGLQVICCGDMGQLPPVNDAYPFETEEWWDLGIKTFELRHVHRQADLAFSRILREIRDGHLSEDGRLILESRVRAYDPDEPPAAVRLTTHNDLAESTNQRKILYIPGDPVVFKSEEDGDSFALEQIDKSCGTPRTLALKVGARVMTTKNDPGGLFVNGSMGTVTWLAPQQADGKGKILSSGSIEVEFDTGRVVVVPLMSWGFGFDDQKELDDLLASGRPCKDGQAWRKQFPIRLAYCITIHRSQGASLDRVSVDLGSCFASGQAYVALSRARTLEGLNIERWNGAGSITAHPTASAFTRGEFRPPPDYYEKKLREAEERERAVAERKRVAEEAQARMRAPPLAPTFPDVTGAPPVGRIGSILAPHMKAIREAEARVGHDQEDEDDPALVMEEMVEKEQQDREDQAAQVRRLQDLGDEDLPF